MRGWLGIRLLWFVGAAGVLGVSGPLPVAAETAQTFTLVNIEYEGSKLWLPGEITVTKGTKVTLKLVNNTPSGDHGFQIPAFGVAAVVKKGEPATVEFTADKAGVFPFSCQLHPAHVGGQLVVQP